MEQKSSGRPKTIGVLIDWTIDPFQQMFLDGVLGFTNQSGMSCIIFEGGRRNSPREYETERNRVFQLANNNTVDGLVILSASIGFFAGTEGMLSFCERFQPMPLISVSMEIGSFPSVLIDNRTGMRELVTHLIDRHAFRRLAFAMGPQGNQDSKERWEACQEVLRERGIPIDPRLVFQGDFTTSSGSRAVMHFLDAGVADIDAIVSFDDGIAMGVMKELAKRKIKVPDQVAVTGFDNVDISGYLTPSLTTVKIPIYMQGWTSAKLVLDLLEGRTVPLKTIIPTKLVIRESCKCVPYSLSVVEGRAKDAPCVPDEGFGSLEEQFPYIHDTIQDHGPSGVYEQIDAPAHSPMHGPAEKTGRNDPGEIIRRIDGLSLRSEQEDLDYETVENMLFDLWRNRTASVSGNGTAVHNEDLLFQSTMKLGHKVVQKEWNRINEFLQERQKLELIRELLVFTDIPKQMDVLAKRLPDLGIESCYLSLYASDPSEDRQQHAVCILGIRDKLRLGAGVEGKDFPSGLLVPDDFLYGSKPRLMIVEPLKQYGFFLFEIITGSNRFAAFLGDIISGALQGALLFKELENQKDGLSRNLENMRKAMGGFIQTMSSTVEARDPYTAGHQRRVSDLARTIAQAMDLPPAQIEGVRMAGIIHDLGKIYIPAEILNRAGILDDIEWSLIKKHPRVAYDILKNIEFPWPIAEIVYQHHERINGTGYPNGLDAKSIHLEARILAVADVVEAMSSHRPYREALGIEKALEEIKKNKGILYDPDVVDVCIELFRVKGYKFHKTDYLVQPARKS